MKAIPLLPVWQQLNQQKRHFDMKANHFLKIDDGFCKKQYCEKNAGADSIISNMKQQEIEVLTPKDAYC